MSVYGRFKKEPGGFRKLVELLESTPAVRRKKMIEVGMQEDREYTEKAMSFLINFDDVLNLPDLELAEVIADTQPKFVGLAIHSASQEIKDRFLSKSQAQQAAIIRETLELPSISLPQIGSAQMKMIEVTRKLEKKGVIRTKRIPPS